jgi:ABC-2 type transport system ATP-binding protein
MSIKTVITVSNLTKSFRGRIVVDKLCFDANEGDILGLLGPNGAGKTTTIRMILNLIKRDSGEVIINGFDTAAEAKKALSSVGCTLEIPSFYDYLTGYENLKLIANLYDNVDEARIQEALDIVGLSERAEDKVKTYSNGMRQRLGIARAILNRPKLVILDEPTNGLDPQGMKFIYDLIRKLSSEEKITFIISSHLLHDVEQICNKIVIINNGKTILKGDTEKLLSENKETVEIQTSEIEKLDSALREISGVRTIELKSKAIIVELESVTFAELNAYLVKSNVQIENIIKSRQSLEELFLNLTTKEEKMGA